MKMQKQVLPLRSTQRQEDIRGVAECNFQDRSAMRFKLNRAPTSARMLLLRQVDHKRASVGVELSTSRRLRGGHRLGGRHVCRLEHCPRLCQAVANVISLPIRRGIDL